MADTPINPASAHVKDYTGKKFGRLTVLSFAGFRNKNQGSRIKRMSLWTCVCDCGNVSVFQGTLIQSGRTQSCGCLQENARKENGKRAKHGMHRTPEYNTWAGMKYRCNNPKSGIFPYYGGRGITVCQRWQDSFEAFYADMGPRPSPKHSIDRINNDGNYEPGNCRWATVAEQRANQRYGNQYHRHVP